MRLALDGTPLLGRPTGVGRYVAGLTEALARRDDAPSITLAAFTMRGVDVPAPAGTRWSGRRVPARALQALWARAPFPPVEWLAGGCDVFHATNFVLPPTRRAAGVVSIHDLSFDQHAETVTPEVLRYQQLVPRGLRHAQVVLTLTETTAQEVRERYGLSDQVMVARPGVDPSWFAVPRPTPEWLASRGLPAEYVLFVGSVEPRKNLPVLLDALRLLPDPPALVLAGPAGWGEALDTRSDIRSGTASLSVVRAGYLADEDLKRVVAGAAVMAYPSRHEGFGLPPLEAFACGVPVVASDLPVLREVTGSLASYVPVGDAEALADALGRALADPGETAPRQAHAAQWTWDRCAAEAMLAYKAGLQAGLQERPRRS